jgi:hypothetical protein
VGLFDRLRGKPDEDQILGGISHAETEIRAEAVSQGESPGAVDAGELMRQLQSAGGDPDRVVEQLRAMFPDAQISVSQSSDATDPGLAARMFGLPAPPPAPGAAADDAIAGLERLAKLHASGALTDAEFTAAKARLLGG